MIVVIASEEEEEEEEEGRLRKIYGGGRGSLSCSCSKAVGYRAHRPTHPTQPKEWGGGTEKNIEGEECCKDE